MIHLFALPCMDTVPLADARAGRAGGSSFRKALMFAGAGYDAYTKIRQDWEEFKARLDSTAQQMATTLNRLDNAQAILNLIRVYQESRGNGAAMKQACTSR